MHGSLASEVAVGYTRSCGYETVRVEPVPSAKANVLNVCCDYAINLLVILTRLVTHLYIFLPLVSVVVLRFPRSPLRRGVTERLAFKGQAMPSRQAELPCGKLGHSRLANIELSPHRGLSHR